MGATNIRQLAEYTAVAAIVISVVLGIMLGCGFFSQPYGMYVQTQGIENSDNGMAIGHVFAVCQDRRPGPDRTIAVFDSIGPALQCLNYLENPPANSLLQRAQRGN